MTYSALDHLDCSRTGERYEADVVQGVSEAGVPLLARYDLERVRETVTPAEIAGREPNLWRYHEVLPVRDPGNVVTLGEGMTPLLPLRSYGERIGVPKLLMKDEGVIPTGSFKARGAAVGVSRAAELGVKGIAMPTNGNAGAAWATYAARAGMRSLIAMPVDAPPITRAECAVAGAELYLVDGLIGDAGKLINKAVTARGGYQEVSTLKEPYRLEGKKTMGYEIAEQLGWRMPDVIMYPTGGGVGLIGIHKAIAEMRELGWIGEKTPKLVAVQAEGCAPIVRAFESGADVSEPFPNAHTVAFGITVPKALGDFLILDAVRSTGGTAIAVSDEALLAEQRRLAGDEGTFICPEGAACMAAAARLRESGWLSGDDEVVVLNTGAGVLYPMTVSVDVPTLPIDGEIPGAGVTDTSWVPGVLAETGRHVADLRTDLLAISHDIHAHPELRFTEHKASARLAEFLAAQGFDVTRGVAGLPTAFRAERVFGTGGPTIAVFCEYDALNGIGHACGHNIIGAAGAGAGVAAARWLAGHGGAGRLLVLGSPAEEGGGGKVTMIEQGELAGVDAAVMVHPTGYDAVHRTMLGRISLEATFTGRASHAAAAPDLGRNALDGATLLLVAIGLLRQQLRSDSRVHANVVDGGQQINVIPERAVVSMFIRSPDVEYLRGRLYDAIRDCVQGAALATGTTAELAEVALSYEPVRTNPVLAEIAGRVYAELGRPVEPESAGAEPAGSTDMGNVSQIVPAMHPYVQVVPGLAIHTHEFATAAAGGEGDRAVVDGATMLATVIAGLFGHPDLVAGARTAFEAPA